MNESQNPTMTRRAALTAGALALAAAALPPSAANAQQKAPGTKTVPEWVTPQELEEWTMRFVAGLSEGVALAKLFPQLAGQTKNEALRVFSENGATAMQLGFTLSNYMAANRALFDEHYVTTVRYGEIYGILDETLERWLRERAKERKKS